MAIINTNKKQFLAEGTGITFTIGDRVVTINSTASGGGLKSGTAAGTDTYTVTITGVTTYTAGDAYVIKFTNANTGASTLNINAIGAIALKKIVSNALASGDITSGQEFLIVYDGTNFQVIPAGYLTPAQAAALYEPIITTLPIAKGGTNSSTALSNNRVMKSSGGAIVEAAAITAAKALKSDANGIPVHFDTATEPSLTELAYVKGVTSAIQTQIDSKIGSSAVVGLQDLYIPVTAMWPRNTTGCGVVKQEMATSLLNIQALAFDQTTSEYAQFTISFPKNWDNGTVTAKFYWTAASGSGTVTWAMQGVAYADDDPLTGTFGTAQSVTDTLLATNDLHISSATAAITIAGTPSDADFVAFQIYRDTADTLNADARLLGVVIQLTTDAAVSS